MAAIWLIFFIGICLAQDNPSLDSCIEDVHYLDSLTIESKKLANGSAETCSDECRGNKLCTHWSWSTELGDCQLKYVPPGTPPEHSHQTGFQSGERFCGSLFPALCPNETTGYPDGGTKKWLDYLTLEQCFSGCKKEYGDKEGKIYIATSKDKNSEGESSCWCELNDNLEQGSDKDKWKKWKTCTLPAGDGPKSVTIKGNETLIAGIQADFTCNFDLKHPTDQYLVPDVSFHLVPDVSFHVADIKYTKPVVNKIQINHIPKIKQFSVSCTVENKESGKFKTKEVKVEWNEIVKIFGNPSPAPGTNQTYNCTTDANPTPNISWTAIYKNGTALHLDKHTNDEITLRLDTDIILTCHSKTNGQFTLENSKKITIVIGKISPGESVGLIVAIISILLLALAIIGFVIIRGIKSKNQRSLRYKQIINRNNDTNSNFPNHIVLNKNNDLGKTIETYSKSKAEVNAEFEALEHFVAKEVKETFSQANAEDNAEHNRYKDILPFDSNFMKISKPAGDPRTTYFNASVIQFSTMKKTFIAAQAPKPNSFSNFWQMILDKKVSTIVMITGLEEGGRIKAHQYWPDMDNKTMKLDNNITINYQSHSFPGTYYHRKLKVKDVNGEERVVNHIQTTAWLDMTAPKRSKILLDLVYQAQDLADKNPILVHCSAGVGRTGTFIAVYKLTADYHNGGVKELDVFSTVVEMRKQRVKMVQKPQQYNYVIKCLKHYVMAQESIYSN